MFRLIQRRKTLREWTLFTGNSHSLAMQQLLDAKDTAVRQIRTTRALTPGETKTVKDRMHLQKLRWKNIKKQNKIKIKIK